MDKLHPYKCFNCTLVTSVTRISIFISECSSLSIINIFNILWTLQVTSKPDLYPLVISYGDSGKGGTGGNYLMVQYFRNYIVRPVGKHKTTVILEMYKIILRKTTALQNVMPCRVADEYQCFGVTCCLHLKSRRWQQHALSTCSYLTYYRASHHIPFSYLPL